MFLGHFQMSSRWPFAKFVFLKMCSLKRFESGVTPKSFSLLTILKGRDPNQEPKLFCDPSQKPESEFHF